MECAFNQLRLRNPRGHYPVSLHGILERLKNAEQDGNIINCFEINVGGRGFLLSGIQCAIQ